MIILTLNCGSSSVKYQVYDWDQKDVLATGLVERVTIGGSSITHKAKGKAGPHKVRVELETRVSNGEQMDAILRALGFAPTFRYEKYRAEWNDGAGHVVLDETPIGNFGEIEGPARWIDRTAAALGIGKSDYITQTYAELFFAWKRSRRSPATEMTFRAIRPRKR